MILTKLLDKKFEVLDKGFIRLVDVMGSDEAIVQAARVSYGKGTTSKSKDENLIRYLMRHRHTSPFEQCELKFHVKVPMDCWRQWIRHRTANVNEYSTRYSIAIDDKQQTEPDKWRLQSKTNKQGSDEYLPKGRKDELILPPQYNRKTGGYHTDSEQRLHDLSQHVYQERIEDGIAREQARKDLPLSTYTEAYWKIDLHNLLHFLSLRMDEHAQWEIRQYANVIGNEIVSKLFPLTWNAFLDYRLHSMTLSQIEIKIIHEINMHQIESKNGFDYDVMDELCEICDWFETRKDGTLKKKRERIEFEEKAKKLKIVVPWK